MLDENFDVVVIGAGPAGSRTAALTARAGLSTLLLEKRKKIGFPVRCAEGIGPRKDVERFLELDDDLISSTVEGIAVVSPGGRWFEAEKRGVGFIVDRERFDKRLADLAVLAPLGHWENADRIGAEQDVRRQFHRVGMIDGVAEIREVLVRWDFSRCPPPGR